MGWRDENIGTILSCRTEKEIFHHLQVEARRLGMQQVSLVFKMPLPLLTPTVKVFTDYPMAWQRRYYAKNYMQIDPTVKHGMTSNLPMLWSDDVMQEAPEFWEEAHGHGLAVGFVQSVFDSHGNCSMLTVSRDSIEFTDTELAEKAPRIAFLAQLLHTGMAGLIVPKEIPEAATHLTLREREVLKLVASGLTSMEIADRLNLSKRTADFYIEEATKKLGAENRTDAAVKATILKLV